MKKIYFVLPIALLLILITSPFVASAHESHIYTIDNKSYQITVGSLNEPVAVDDKSGAYIKVVLAGQEDEEAHHEEESSAAVALLEQTLKVEVSAGENKKKMDLQPIHGEAGAYRTTFIPTIQTTYAYRFFGTINNTEVDLSFTCNPAGHPVSEEDTSVVKISDGVTRTSKRGAFGCPVARADLGFPEPSGTTYEMQSDIRSAENSAMAFGWTGILLGLLGAITGIAALRRKS